MLRRLKSFIQAAALHAVNKPAVDAIARQAKTLKRQRQAIARLTTQIYRQRRRAQAKLSQSRIFRLQIWRSLNGKN